MKHRERLNKKIFSTYIDKFKDCPYPMVVSDDDFNLFIKECKTNGLPVFTEYGQVIIVSKTLVSKSKSKGKK